jgi:hypothetical protein
MDIPSMDELRLLIADFVTSVTGKATWALASRIFDLSPVAGRTLQPDAGTSRQRSAGGAAAPKKIVSEIGRSVRPKSPGPFGPDRAARQMFERSREVARAISLRPSRRACSS